MGPIVRRCYAAGAVVAACIAFFFAVFTGPLPYHWRLDGFNDTLLHMGAFGLLTLLVLPISSRLLTGILILGLFAVLLEVVQLMLPYRTADLGDLAASLTGVGLGGAALFILSAVEGALTRKLGSRR